MLIRTLNDGDIEQAIELEAIVYEHVSGTPLTDKNRFEHWFKVIDQELTVGMFDGPNLIGTAYAVDLNPGMGDSSYKRESLVIHPGYAGKGKSLGKQLFETMLAMVDCTAPNRSSHSYIGDDNGPMMALTQGLVHRLATTSTAMKKKAEITAHGRASRLHISSAQKITSNASSHP